MNIDAIRKALAFENTRVQRFFREPGDFFCCGVINLPNKSRKGHETTAFTEVNAHAFSSDIMPYGPDISP